MGTGWPNINFSFYFFLSKSICPDHKLSLAWDWDIDGHTIIQLATHDTFDRTHTHIIITLPKRPQTNERMWQRCPLSNWQHTAHFCKNSLFFHNRNYNLVQSPQCVAAFQLMNISIYTIPCATQLRHHKSFQPKHALVSYGHGSRSIAQFIRSFVTLWCAPDSIPIPIPSFG